MVRVRAPISTTWPWASWRITTRLASHARRRDVSAETCVSSSRMDWPGASVSARTGASTWTTTWYRSPALPGSIPRWSAVSATSAIASACCWAIVGVTSETSVPEVTPTIAQQQADAIALVAETALHRGIDPGNAGDRYQVVVHVDTPVLADSDAPGQSILDEDTHVSAETSRRLACDASRVVMRHDAQGHVVEIGARTRTIPPALRRALDYRDRGCRFPGCGVQFGQGHHIRHWAHGGPTTLSNLALLCRRNHRAVHEEGYQVDRQPDGTLSFRRPDGALLPAVPPPAPVPAQAVEVLRARHDEHGLHIHARTSMPGWLGERLDVGWAISVLHPLAG